MRNHKVNLLSIVAGIAAYHAMKATYVYVIGSADADNLIAAAQSAAVYQLMLRTWLTCGVFSVLAFAYHHLKV